MSNTFALLTGPHPAAIAVLRIAGPAVPAFLSQHFTGKPAVGKLSHGRLLATPDFQLPTPATIDDPVVALLTPTSADLSLHGGREILRQTRALLTQQGFLESPLPATATEEKIAALLPLCRTELAVRTLLAQRHNQHLSPSPSRALHHLLHPPTIALVGLPNVGKSTLANALSRTTASLTADLPGTTRDYVEIEADLDGLLVRLLDTPGQHDTPDPIERAAISLSRRAIATADLTLLITDASRPSHPEELALLAAHPRSLHVATRSDLPRLLQGEVPALRVSAKTGEGLPALTAAIHAHFGIAATLASENLLAATIS